MEISSNAICDHKTQVGIKFSVLTSSNPSSVAYLPNHLQLIISAPIILAPLSCFIELKEHQDPKSTQETSYFS